MHPELLQGGVKMETRKRPDVCWALRTVQRCEEDVEEASILVKTVRTGILACPGGGEEAVWLLQQ